MSPSEYQNLLEFLGHRFEVIDRRFEAIDQQFVGIFRRFDTVDWRFEAMQGQIDGNHREALGHFGEIDRRLERLDQDQGSIYENQTAARRDFTLTTDPEPAPRT